MPRIPTHRLSAATLAAALAGPLGLAAAPALARPGIDGVRFDAPRTVRYRCDEGKQLSARYFNSADNQIAILRLDGKAPLLFVSVLTGSGARYAHGIHQWITKGDEGRLQDLTRGDDAPAVYANCKAAG